jgi:hypothetical protein
VVDVQQGRRRFLFSFNTSLKKLKYYQTNKQKAKQDDDCLTRAASKNLKRGCVTFGFELVVSSAEVNTESVSLAFKLHC